MSVLRNVIDVWVALCARDRAMPWSPAIPVTSARPTRR
jgi:hypothetical protein